MQSRNLILNFSWLASLALAASLMALVERSLAWIVIASSLFVLVLIVEVGVRRSQRATLQKRQALRSAMSKAEQPVSSPGNIGQVAHQARVRLERGAMALAVAPAPLERGDNEGVEQGGYPSTGTAKSGRDLSGQSIQLIAKCFPINDRGALTCPVSNS